MGWQTLLVFSLPSQKSPLALSIFHPLYVHLRERLRHGRGDRRRRRRRRSSRDRSDSRRRRSSRRRLPLFPFRTAAGRPLLFFSFLFFFPSLPLPPPPLPPPPPQSFA